MEENCSPGFDNPKIVGRNDFVANLFRLDLSCTNFFSQPNSSLISDPSRMFPHLQLRREKSQGVVNAKGPRQINSCAHLPR